MDDRQRQIREGAGLEESRLNVEFIDFIKVWGPRLLFVITIVVGIYAYVVWNRQRKETGLDRAFVEFHELAGPGANPSPEALVDFARSHRKTPGLAATSELQAADMYLTAIRTGVEPGATAQGGVYAESDLLSDARRTQLLDMAAGLYQGVIDACANVEGRELFAIKGAFGLAAVAESRGDWSAAKAAYEQAVRLGENTEFKGLASIAKSRIEGLEALKAVPTFYAEADLPKPPPPPEPPAPETPDEPVSGDDSAGGNEPGADAPVNPQERAPGEPQPEPGPDPTEPGGEPPAQHEPPSSPPPA